MNKSTLFLQILTTRFSKMRQTCIALDRILLLVLGLLALGLGSSPAHAQDNDYSETVLHNFSGDPGSESAFPYGGLIFLNSTLYGTTSGGYFHGNNGQYGGTGNTGTGYGAVFAMHTDGSGLATLHSFSGGTDGAYPYGRLLAVNGILYGTTYQGGTYGDGTVFAVNPSTGNETVLHSFGATAKDGANPIAGLVLANGNLYGTTSGGGTNNDGTVFTVKPNGTGYKTLYRFTATSGDGATPYAALILAGSILYGTTEYGGASGEGTVFSFDPSTNTEMPLHQFTGTSGDGSTPLSDLLYANGLLYGTTYSGGTSSDGTVFSIHTDGTAYQTMYQFTAADGEPQFPPLGVNADGAQPISGLSLINGLLYGTTSAGGTRGVGTLFFIDPVTDGETTLCELQGANDPPGADTPGGSPSGDLLDVNGVLYTTCYAGAGGYGLGYGSVIALSTDVNAPVAYDDTYTPSYAKPLTVKAPGVLGNDENGGSGSVTADLVSSVSHGTLTFNSDGSFYYTPSVGFVGTDTFTYQATNSAGKSNVATVNLVIRTSAPTARNDSYSVKHNTVLTVDAPGVLTNDYNGDTGSFTAVLVTSTSNGMLTFHSNGMLTFHSDGSFSYTPNTGFTGTDSFTYQAVNLIGKSNVATVTITVK